MNPNRAWYEYRSVALKAVNKWMKQGFASSKGFREEFFYKYSCVLPSSLKKKQQWNCVVDAEVTTILQDTHSMNWWHVSTKLHAVKIPEDTESIYNSISVALWGVPDSKGLVSFLFKTTLKLHSRLWEIRFNQDSEHKVRSETWRSDVKNLTPEHIFIFSNVLQRPIIVVTGEGRENNAASFRGIYLPLMSKPINCSKMPIFLAYLNGHFSPLVMEVPTEDEKGALMKRYSIIFPLATNDFGMLPVKFLQANEEIRAGEFLQDYLIVKDTDVPLANGMSRLLFTHSECYTLPEDKNVILDYLTTSKQQSDKIRLNHSKIMSNPMRFVKSALNTGKNKGAPLMDPQTNNIDQSDKSDKGAHFVVNQNGVAHGGNDPFDFKSNTSPVLQEPSAPEMSIEPNAPELSLVPDAPMMSLTLAEPLSMTNVRCTSCKTYRSSANTFPLCHECHDRKYKTAQGDTDQQKKLEYYSNQNPKNDVILPVKNVSGMGKVDSKDHVNLPVKSLSDTSKVATTTTAKDERITTSTSSGVSVAVGELSPSRSSMRSDDNFVEVSCQASFDQLSAVIDEPNVCGSPVCQENIPSGEVLCQKCIKVLKVHHLTNCNKSCCQNTDNPFNSDNSVLGMNMNQGDEKLEYGIRESSSSMQHPDPEKEKNILSRMIDQCDMHNSNTHRITRTVSQPESHNVERRSVTNVNTHRTISEPEEVTYCSDSNPDPSKSVMVTSLTSIDESNKLLNALFAGGERLPNSQSPSVTANSNPEGNSTFSETLGTEKKRNSAKGKEQTVITVRGSEGLKSNDVHQRMEYLEYDFFKKDVYKCTTYSCTNYGSKQKNGYCNKCYNEMNVNHEPFWDGMDQCDGLDSAIEVDMVDGLDADVSPPYTMPDLSSSDSSDFFVSEPEND